MWATLAGCHVFGRVYLPAMSVIWLAGTSPLDMAAEVSAVDSLRPGYGGVDPVPERPGGP